MPAPVHAATAAEVPYSMSSGWATTHSTRRIPSSGRGGSGVEEVSMLFSLGGHGRSAGAITQPVHGRTAGAVGADGGGAGSVAEQVDARVVGDGRAVHGDAAAAVVQGQRPQVPQLVAEPRGPQQHVQRRLLPVLLAHALRGDR